MRAVYRDSQGRTYSAPVEKRGDSWVMLTTDGPQPIATTFVDDNAGTLTFDSYREETDERLHLPERLPGESSFRQLQRANAERIHDEREQRTQRRQHIEESSRNPRIEKLAEAARAQAAEIAHPRRPNGSGVGLVIEPKE